MYNVNQVQRGWDAYGSDGQKIGSILERRDTYLVVEKGMFFPKDIYVPADAIERADPNEQRVYLNVAKDDVEGMGWTEPQTVGTTSATSTAASDTWADSQDPYGVGSRDRYEEPAGTMATKRTHYGDDGHEHGAEVAGGGVG